MVIAMLATILKDGSYDAWYIWASVIAGCAIGLFLSNKVKMIEMPQLVAFLNGIGGGSAGIVGFLILIKSGQDLNWFVFLSSGLAVLTGMMTISGAFVAAGKLARLLPQQPVVLKNHNLIINIIIGAMLIATLAITFSGNDQNPYLWSSVLLVLGLAFGIIFTVRLAGADMPITISLLNSLAGISGAIAGFAIGDIQLVAIGGIVGSAGLLLTQVMCRAMNKHLFDILLGKTAVGAGKPKPAAAAKPAAAPAPQATGKDYGALLRGAKKVIIVPGYGMALAQAQHKVKQLADALVKNGAEVNYAIHPVAGRMPGHMNVLLAECNVDYEQLLEMDTVNPMFKDTDVVIVVGANDVVNPAAMEAEGTPIYGMPILRADEAKNVIVCNYDTKPGYAGVDNPLYTMDSAIMMLGDASETMDKLLAGLSGADTSATAGAPAASGVGAVLNDAKKVIIVPGYGMALAQAQQKVKQLADTLEAKGAKVDFAIHPVAGRMPGHMNVLLAEANVDYEQLLEMDTVNPMFKDTDVVIVVGANDVVNPAAMEAEGTPIYGMPILTINDAKHIVICNFDTKPGYAGVDNPLYTSDKVTMKLGDAAQTVQELIDACSAPVGGGASAAPAAGGVDLPSLVQNAKKVIIVPGYGMALAQAQQKVKQLADTLEAKGADVEFAIHPVAGRMPGHMNVLLAEANVEYEKLLEMDTVNPMFPETDLVIVVGANDVVNPAAMEAEGTPIYGMPILRADAAKNVIVCNFDTKPGYAGVDNPLYEMDTTIMLLGDASETVQSLIDACSAPVGGGAAAPAAGGSSNAEAIVAGAKKVIIVPGYGMALAQAQQKVKQLADTLEANGAEVEFAIHPVAGRMPGHMNVLLAEANVDYEKLLEMDTVNPMFPETDLVVVIGANDVVNPAAMEAEGTPIYGMPILRADEAKSIIVCNFDDKPGYAGVDNPLYTMDKTIMMLGDAADTVDSLIKMVPKK